MSYTADVGDAPRLRKLIACFFVSIYDLMQVSKLDNYKIYFFYSRKNVKKQGIFEAAEKVEQKGEE